MMSNFFKGATCYSVDSVSSDYQLAIGLPLSFFIIVYIRIIPQQLCHHFWMILIFRKLHQESLTQFFSAESILGRRMFSIEC